MAELNTNSNGNSGRVRRSSKQATRLDLTAMVDLAFLLILFWALPFAMKF